MQTRQWLKMWLEARHDPKLDALTDKQFRLWFRLLLLSAEQEPRGSVDISDMKLVGIETRYTNLGALQACIDALKSVHLIRVEDTVLSFIGFESRQSCKPSDQPERVRERVKRHRNAHVTPLVTPCNAPEVEEEVDTEPLCIPPLDIETLKVLHRYSGWNGDKTAAKNFAAFHADFPRHDLDACAKSWATWAEDAKNPPKNCWLSFRNWVQRTEVKASGSLAGF